MHAKLGNAGKGDNCPNRSHDGGPPDRQGRKCPVAYVRWLPDAMQSALEVANRILGSADRRQKGYYDRIAKKVL